MGLWTEWERISTRYKGLVLRRLSCGIRASAIDPSIDVLVVHGDIWMRMMEAVMYYRFGKAVPEDQV